MFFDGSASLILSIAISVRADLGVPMLTPELFWKTKDIYKGIVEDRQVAVRARIDSDRPLKSMEIETAGLVSAPLSFTYKKILEFEKLPLVSTYFDEAKYYPDRQRLFLRLSALGYHVQMILQLKFVENERDKIIEWESVEGGFKGMKGSIHIGDFHHVKTEISFQTFYEAVVLPLPKILLSSIPLEFMGQKAAERMRSFIEEEYRKDEMTKNK